MTTTTIVDSKIQWPRATYWDKPWNPILGCVPISPACDNCYARISTERFKGSFVPHKTSKQKPPRKGVVFCGNMTDLFGGFVDDYTVEDWINATAGRFYDATYLWLTKRPDEMCGILKHTVFVPNYDPDEGLYLSEIEMGNQFFGFTAENQEWYDKRFYGWIAGRPKWTNGWLSAEPLLGPIDLHLDGIAPEFMPFKWVVVGCESGSKRRPCKIEWVESIVKQASEKGIPVFVKQLAINGKCETDISKFPEHLRIRQVPWIEKKRTY